MQNADEQSYIYVTDVLFMLIISVPDVPQTLSDDHLLFIIGNTCVIFVRYY